MDRTAARIREYMVAPGALPGVDAVIFDMDGVIVDSVARKRDHWARVLRDEFDVTGIEMEELIGLNTDDKYDYLVERAGLTADRAEFDERLNAGVGRIYREEVELLAGVEATLDWLADRGVAVGLASAAGREKVDLVVERFDLGDALDAVVSADDIAGDSKPDPAIYEHAASLLSADPAACVAVEDSTHGVTAATAAGAYCIAYQPPDSPKPNVDHADEVATAPEELHERVRALVAGEVEPQ